MKGNYILLPQSCKLLFLLSAIGKYRREQSTGGAAFCADEVLGNYWKDEEVLIFKIF